MSDSADEKDKSEKEEEEDKIKLKFIRFGRDEIHFRIKMTTQMGKLKRGYAAKLGVNKSYFRFIFDGRRISDNETPEQLKMEPDDAIEVFTQQPCPLCFSNFSQPSNQMPQSEIQRLLQCIVCLEPCASPIYTCLDNGHLICGFCHDKLETTGAYCPLCKCKALQPNPLAERQSRQHDMRGKCPFSGCFERVLSAELMAHVKNCEYREIQCTSTRMAGSEEGCNEMFPLKEFPRHAIKVHKTRMVKRTSLDNMFPAFSLDVPFKAGNEQSEKYWGPSADQFGQFLCEYDEKYFTIHAAVRNYMFYWWLTIYGVQKEADQYTYETELLWKNFDEQKAKNVVGVQTLPVLPYNRFEKYDISCGNYAMVHAATATAYSAKRADDSQVRKLTVRIKISKTNTDEIASFTCRSEGTKRDADTTNAKKRKRRK